MNRFGFRGSVCVFLFALSCVPVLSALGVRVLSATMSDTPYVVAPDEAYTLSSEISFLDHGYWGFRCKASQMNYCYGTGQTVLDTITLALFPKSWVLANPTSDQHLEIRWPYLVEYPHVAKVLRWQRAAFILISLLALGFWAWPLGLTAAATLALALGSSYPFVAAWLGNWQGIKSDYPAVFFAILQVVVACNARRMIREGSSLKKVLAAGLGLNLLGLFATGVRASNLPLWGASAFWFFYWLWAGRVCSRFKLVAYAVATVGICGIAYLLTYPNTWASAAEAGWFVYWLKLGAAPHSVRVSWAHCLKVFWLSSRELLLFGLAGYVFARRFGYRRFFVDYGFVVLAILPQLKNAYLLAIPPYYLGISTVAIAAAIDLLKQTGLARRLLAGIAVIGLAWNLALAGSGAVPLRSRFQPGSPSATEREVALALPAGHPRMLLDRTLRLPVTRANDSAMSYFDSLTDGPEEVGEMLIDQPGIEKVMIACWSPQNPVLSPAAQEWTQLLGRRCRGEGQKLTSFSFQQIISVLKGGPAVELKREDLLDLVRGSEGRAESVAEFSDPNRLSVRTMRGTSTFADGWDARLQTRNSGQIEGKYKMGFEGSFSSWTVSTTCEEPVSVNVLMRKNGTFAFKRRIELNAVSRVCEQHWLACKVSQSLARTYFRSQQDQILAPIPVEFKQGDRIDIQLALEKSGAAKSCLFILNDFLLSRTPVAG